VKHDDWKKVVLKSLFHAPATSRRAFDQDNNRRKTFRNVDTATPLRSLTAYNHSLMKKVFHKSIKNKLKTRCSLARPTEDITFGKYYIHIYDSSAWKHRSFSFVADWYDLYFCNLPWSCQKIISDSLKITILLLLFDMHCSTLLQKGWI